MKIETRQVYICEHCGRKMLGKGVMSGHERFCTQNPQNWHKCFDYCLHLEKTETYVQQDTDDAPTRKIEFTCKKTGQKMYSFKLEKYTGLSPDYMDGMVRMPLECEYFETTTDYFFKSIQKEAGQ